MKIVEVYRSADGSLHDDKTRAAADLHHALPRSSTNSNAKLFDWTDCLRIIENRGIIEKAFADLDAMGEIGFDREK